MRDYAVFIPSGDASIAAVIAVPDRDPLGLVVLLPGVTSGRSHRFQLWTRAAERLAALGLASIRIDYRGTGDSSGVAVPPDLQSLPTDEMLRACAFAARAVGTDRFATVGNCYGARIALTMAERSERCAGTLVLSAPIQQRSVVAGSLVKARKGRLGKLLRKTPLRRSDLVRRMANRKRQPSEELRRTIRTAVRRGPVEFLYSSEDFTLGEGLRSQLEGIVSDLPPDLRARMTVNVQSATGLAGLQSLTVQEALMEEIEDWAVRCFPEVRTEAARVTG